MTADEKNKTSRIRQKLESEGFKDVFKPVLLGLLAAENYYLRFNKNGECSCSCTIVSSVFGTNGELRTLIEKDDFSIYLILDNFFYWYVEKNFTFDEVFIMLKERIEK